MKINKIKYKKKEKSFSSLSGQKQQQSAISHYAVHIIQNTKQMEISVLGGGFQQVITRLSPFASLSTPSSSPQSATKAKSSHLTPATSLLQIESQIEPTHVSVTPRRRYHSVAYKARQSAILEVQQSSDLGSALARSLFPPFSFNFFNVFVYCINLFYFPFFGPLLRFPFTLLKIELEITVLLTD